MLVPLPVDLERQIDIEYIIDLVRRREPRPRRVEGRRRLSLHPLTAPLDLPFPLAHVVDQHVAGDGGSRFGLIGQVQRTAPMTTPSSTSQSVFTEPRGNGLCRWAR